MRNKNIIKALHFALLGFMALGIAGCLGKNYPKDFRTDKSNQTNATGTMKPYTVNGKTYYPTVVGVGETATGIASWYGPGFHGKKTSNGEIYNQNAFTAAHKTLPMNTIVSVTNLDNGRKTTVRINDRGPFKDNRIIDVSKAAATRLDMLQSGTVPVKLEVIGFDSSGEAADTADIADITIPQAQIIEGISAEQNLSATSQNVEQNLSSIAQNIDIAALSSASSGSGFMVQIGAFKSKDNADDVSSRYQSYKGYTTMTRQSSRDGLYRVFLKGFKSESEAKELVRSGAFEGAFVVKE